jgi:hypothetical protein
MFSNIPDGPLVVPSFDSDDSVTGYRLWIMGDTEGIPLHLTAVAVHAAWPAGRPMQGCPELGAGVHACRTLEYLCKNVSGYVNRFHKFVIGEVGLAGRVDVYDEGYRAELGYPTVLYIDTNADNAQSATRAEILALCRFYGCEFREVCLPRYGRVKDEDTEHTCGTDDRHPRYRLPKLRKMALICAKCAAELEWREEHAAKAEIARKAHAAKMLGYLQAREQVIPGRNWSEFCVTETKMLLDAGIAPDIARRTVIDMIVELRTNNPNDPCRNWAQVRSNLTVSYNLAIRAHEARVRRQAD